MLDHGPSIQRVGENIMLTSYLMQRILIHKLKKASIAGIRRRCKHVQDFAWGSQSIICNEFYYPQSDNSFTLVSL